MFFEDEEACCCCGTDSAKDQDDCDCGCDCESDNDCDCDCGCGHEHSSGIITMTDTETGKEYAFVLADDFSFEDEHYCVLVTADNDQEPEMVITRVVTMEDGTEGLMSLDDAEYDRIYAEYERLCEEEDDEEEDDEDEG